MHALRYPNHCSGNGPLTPCGRPRGRHVPSPSYGATLRLPSCPAVASPHAAGHQAPHGLHAPLAIRTRRSDAPWDGLPPPVLLVPVLGADEPTPRPAHIGTESLEAAATYFLRADGSLRSLDLAANYRVTVIRDRREATNREFKKIATLCTSIEGVALSDVLGIPPTGIELYLNNCYVCILSAIIQN